MGLAGLAACRQPNPEWLGPAGDPITSDASASASASTSTSASSDGSDTSGTSGDSTDGTTTSPPIPMQCAPEPVLGEGECPAACTSCDGGRCLVDCGTTDCSNTDVTCPEGWPCDIACTVADACKRGDLSCATDRDCTVTCQGVEACMNAMIVCGAGTCAVTCSADDNTCRKLDVVCGPADSTLTCASANNADLVPSAGSPCACEAIGCEG